MTHETDALEPQKVSERNPETASSQKTSRDTRRRFIKAGMIGVPVILTLKSTAAWGNGVAGTPHSILYSVAAGSSIHPGVELPPGWEKKG